jgi:hypothetical protein
MGGGKGEGVAMSDIDEAAIRARAETFAIAFGREEAQDLFDLLSLLDAARRERDEARVELAKESADAEEWSTKCGLAWRDRDALRAALERVAATDLTHMITRAAAFDVLENLVIGTRDALAAVQAKEKT